MQKIFSECDAVLVMADYSIYNYGLILMRPSQMVDSKRR